MYKLLLNPMTKELDIIVLRVVDNAFIPFAPDNIDYQRYLEWLAEGNEPQPADEQ